MRTTVTLDEDVVSLLRAAKERSHTSFKQVLNAAVRRGLKGEGGAAEEPFVLTARSLGLRPGIDPARLRELDDELELQEFRRKTRALEARQDDRS
jgi:hypothetical protein